MQVNDVIWNEIIKCKSYLDREIPFCIHVFGDTIKSMAKSDDELQNVDNLVVKLDRKLPPKDSPLWAKMTGEVKFALENYVFLVLTQLKERKKPMVLLHYAQSLDGKIATISGKSQWIGNDENLFHAHRLRALLDGILVGGNTLRNDNPKLNVRKVAGNDPTRVLLCSEVNSLDSLLKSSDSKIVCFCNSIYDHQHAEQVEVVHFEKNQRPTAKSILEELKNRGIKSLLVEGGSATGSMFVKEDCVDIVQLHIAPLLFGSGISIYKTDPIDEVDESINFLDTRFDSMGEAIMFTGLLYED